MEAPPLLTREHPSFGFDKVAFLFNENGKLILVEAENSWAVQVIERILLQDKTVSPTCRVLAVFRNVTNIGLRTDDDIESINYVDFMIDKVEPSRILADSAMSYSFRCSLSDAECKKASQKLAKELEGKPRAGELDMKTEGPNPSSKNKLIRLEGGLLGLGFKKSQISAWMKDSKSKVETHTVEELIRSAISEMTSAA
jgi:hypothetical protein